MKLNKRNMMALLCSALFALQLNAATIVLKDGRSLEGEIKAQDSEKITLDMNGLEMIVPLDKISSVDLSSTAKETPTAKATPATELKQGTATVAAGTAITVKINEGFNSRHNKTGQRFTAVLESNLVSEGVIVAPQGSKVYGVLTEVKKAGRLAGVASMRFELTDVSINGTMFPIRTHTLSGAGENTAKNTAGKTARAAAIGGLIDGSDGAKTGAKVGVGASILTQGNDIQVSAGEVIDFILSAPFTPK